MKQVRFTSTAHHSLWLEIQIFRDAVFFNVAFLTGFGACPTVMLRNHFRNNASQNLNYQPLESSVRSNSELSCCLSQTNDKRLKNTNYADQWNTYRALRNVFHVKLQDGKKTNSISQITVQYLL